MDDNYDLLSKEALNYSMEMIKNDLNKLGVSHDNFVSEKSIVEKNKLSCYRLLAYDFIFWIVSLVVSVYLFRTQINDFINNIPLKTKDKNIKNL